MDRKKLTASTLALPVDSSKGASCTRPIAQNFHLASLTNEPEELEKRFPDAYNYLKGIFKSVNTFSNGDLFVDSLWDINDKKVIVIVSGSLGQNIVPVIHDIAVIDSIFIFCHQIAYHEQWTKVWVKVKGVYNKIDSLCQAVVQSIQKHELSPTSSPKLLSKPTSEIHHSLSPGRPTSSRAHRDREAVVDDEQHKSNRKRTHRRGHSSSRSRLPSDQVDSSASFAMSGPAEKSLQDISLPHEKANEKASSRASSDKVRLAFVDQTDTVDNHLKKLDIPKDRSYVPVKSIKDDETDESTLTNSLTPVMTTAASSSQQTLPLNFEGLERTIMHRTQLELRKSLLDNSDIYQRKSPNSNAIDRLQHTLVETIGKHATKKEDNPNELNNLFSQLKEVLVEAVVQQQSAILQDVIKQTVLDAFKQQQVPAPPPSSTITTTNAGVTYRQTPTIITTNREVKIAANRKLTCIDTAFRQKREAVVSNKQLRDVVQKWSSISSMSDLAIAIKTNGTNKLECAWLLFCWVCQNIQYQPYCDNNAAESVFRTRKGVCRGFVSLFHECCSLLDIECSEISGYVKQTFFKPGEELKQSPHAWNSIVLDEYTYLIDPTWGAGGRDNDKKLEEFYFLTSPEELIYTHYVNGYQLLDPEISKEEFLSLPVMKSTYYRLGLTLISPKLGLNKTNQNLFKITIQTPAHVDLFAQLKVGDVEYPRNFHTLCQRDETKPDVYNCYISPPLDGLYDITIYAKINTETMYTDAINMRLCVSNVANAFIFPIIYSTFIEHKCILIEPLQRLVRKNEKILIHMIIPNANVIKIRNGDDNMVPHKDEYRDGVLKKQLCVQSDLQVCARWDDRADSISILCIFNMI